MRTGATMGERERDSGLAGFSTRAIHAGQDPEPTTGAVVTPISLSTTFAQDGVGGHKGYEYSRTQNPTRMAWERLQRLALEFDVGRHYTEAEVNERLHPFFTENVIQLPFKF